MAFIPDNYLTAQRALAQITTDATSFHTDVSRGIEILTQAHAKLAAMGADWKAAVDFIQAQADANPADEEWKALASQKDKLVADFIAMRNRALAVRNAATAAG